MPGANFIRAALVAAALNGVDAFWRLPCRGRSGLGLIDPIVDTGKVSGHAHTIHGSSNFGLDVTNAEMMQGNCTSCGVKEDLSTYWTPPMYFMYANGTSVMLDQEGGMLSYYLLYGDDIVEFPQGFQMVAGDSTRRNFTCKNPEPPKSLWSGYEVTQDALSQKALGFNCLNYAKTPEPSLGRHGLPTKDFIDANCPDGLRLEVFFPSCWNGKDATAPDHKSHMAYPSLVNGGDCPAGFPKRTVSLFFETIWNTAPFKGEDGQFVISMGDNTGYGYHGDFMAGWQEGHLQQAIQTCTNPSGEVSDCPLFNLNTDDEMGQCTFPEPPQLAGNDNLGPMPGLPGGCTVQSGPEPAIPNHAGGKPSSGPSSSSAAASSSGSSAAPPSYASTSVSSVSTDAASAAAQRPGSTTGDLVIAQAMPTGGLEIGNKAAQGASSSSDAPSSSVTPAPSSAPASSSSGGCAASTTTVSDGVQYDVCIEDVVHYVTATAEAPNAAHKRHLHEHVHHRRAGHAGHF